MTDPKDDEVPVLVEFNEEFILSFYFQSWIVVLSSPRILRAMRRVPTKEHLLRMLDAFLPYARSTRQRGGTDHLPLDPKKREACALTLRDAIERWDSPDISLEITQAARALAREDHNVASDEEWDAYEADLSPPEDYLLWPEGVPIQLKEQEKQEQEQEQKE